MKWPACVLAKVVWMCPTVTWLASSTVLSFLDEGYLRLPPRSIDQVNAVVMNYKGMACSQGSLHITTRLVLFEPQTSDTAITWTSVHV